MDNQIEYYPRKPLVHFQFPFHKVYGNDLRIIYETSSEKLRSSFFSQKSESKVKMSILIIDNAIESKYNI